MNGLDEFAEVAAVIFVVIIGLMVLLTYLEQGLYRPARERARTARDKPGTIGALHGWWLKRKRRR